MAVKTGKQWKKRSGAFPSFCCSSIIGIPPKSRDETPPESCQSKGVMIIALLPSREAACASMKTEKTYTKLKAFFMSHLQQNAKNSEAIWRERKGNSDSGGHMENMILIPACSQNYSF